MPPDDSPRPGDQHVTKQMLGPHVVGMRVVVRRVLRGQVGPSGGPAYADVLGTCVAWGEEGCVVLPESGEPVRIALADVFSGKPVPPRPSVRSRVTPAEAQRTALAMWPGILTEPLGAWLLRRYDGAPARRANSVLAFGPSGVDCDLARVTAWYAASGRRPIAAVLSRSPEEDRLRAAGWDFESHDRDTVFQVGGVARARRLLVEVPAVEVEVAESPGLATATVRLDGASAATGVAACPEGGDWVGFRGIEVAPDHRRRGLGRAVMAALLEWGAERGATTAYLQVLADNAPALALYDGLGLVEHHRYRYLSPARRVE